MSKHENGKLCAILAYLLVGIIWYFVDEKMKKDEFAKFHVKQGLVLLIASVLLSIIIMILGGILMLIPGIGLIIPVLAWIANIVIFILWIIGIINAAQDKKSKLPIIGGYAESLKI